MQSAALKTRFWQSAVTSRASCRDQSARQQTATSLNIYHLMLAFLLIRTLSDVQIADTQAQHFRALSSAVILLLWGELFQPRRFCDGKTNRLGRLLFPCYVKWVNFSVIHKISVSSII
jgi:hypothetical protein